MTSAVDQSKLRRILLVTLIAATGSGLSCATDLERRFQAHINYLASDALEGRGVGSHGIQLAAAYIARQFEEIGLEPTAPRNSYFHAVPMTLRRSLTSAGRLAFDGDPEPLRQGHDFAPLAVSSNEAFDAKLVFCGYGIVSPQKGRDDFVQVDLTGRIALMFRGYPSSWAEDEADVARQILFRTKMYNAKDRGAVAVLVVNQAPPPGEPDALTSFESESPDQYGIPAFQLTRSALAGRLTKAGLDSLERLQERLDAGEYVSQTLDNLRVSGQAGLSMEATTSSNVAGLLPGAGPLAGEVVILGAHYDHLGIRRPMMRKFKAGKLVRYDARPEIHNGADDNASGTSALLEIARMLAAGAKPKRSILFIAFTGEEAGLHGSKRYIDEPLAPLGKTVAMLNMDMIGRLPKGSRKVQVFGADPGTDLGEIAKAAALAIGLEIAPAVDSGGRSDHAPFVNRRIPSLHFYTGSHKDYHKPTDDADRINARGGAKVVRLVRAVAWDLANREGRPAFHTSKKKKQGLTGATSTFRVVMGLTPSYVDDGQPGMGVDAVSSEGPAEQAGMKAGDRIIRINGKPVANIYDYMASTRNNEPGDPVYVIVLREGREHNLLVTLAPAQ